MPRFPGCFALGISETFTDAAVGVRQQSSAPQKITSSLFSKRMVVVLSGASINSDFVSAICKPPNLKSDRVFKSVVNVHTASARYIGGGGRAAPQFHPPGTSGTCGRQSRVGAHPEPIACRTARRHRGRCFRWSTPPVAGGRPVGKLAEGAPLPPVICRLREGHPGNDEQLSPCGGCIRCRWVP